ncbi:MAG: RNB domain-containing ribonuclease [Rariglobus sp.]
MKFREPLLEILRQPGYRPGTILDLSKALGLNKKLRPQLAHEIRTLLGRGELSLVNGDRITLPGSTSHLKPSPSRADRGNGRNDQRGNSSRERDQRSPDSNQGGETLTGRIQFRAGGSAYVVPARPVGPGPSPEPIQIFPDDTGIALHGDTVEIFVNPGIHHRRDGRGTERTGRVLQVLDRPRDTVVGNLQKVRSSYYVKPDDPRFFHEVAVADPAKSRLDPIPEAGDKVVVRLAPWTQRSQLIQGTIIERLGKTFEPRAELAGVYHKFKLDPTFPANVEKEVASLPDTVQSAELAGRKDYRNIPTFTIDPDDAKDFDDALSIETEANGDIRIGIHIADVSAYVKPGTALDAEAQRRGNSTYLVGTVIPMLPEKLSNGLCSLVEAQDRLTKAVFLTFDAKGRPKGHTYANTVIRSRKRLTYKQAYALLFEDSLDKIRALPLPAKHQTGSTGRALSSLTNNELTDLQTWVRLLWKLASGLRRDRMANGSLDLDMPETKVFVDAEGYADRLEKIEHDESHQLIEEFMLAANEAVARLTREQRMASLYRVHDEPDADKLSELAEFLKTFDVDAHDLTQRQYIVKLLEDLRHHPQGYTLRTQLLRSLKKAAYRGTPDGHYGLNKNDYTHFTSPIRRYSDLVVHRVFDRYLDQAAGKPAPANYVYNAAKMNTLGEHLSLTETNSQEAERESVKIKMLEFFERELAKETKTLFAAVITDVRPNGLFIELTESMTFGFLPASKLDDDYYMINNAGTSLVGRKTKKSYDLGGRIEVLVDKVDRFKRLIDFKPATSAAVPTLKQEIAPAPIARPTSAHPSLTPKKKLKMQSPKPSASASKPKAKSAQKSQSRPPKAQMTGAEKRKDRAAREAEAQAAGFQSGSKFIPAKKGQSAKAKAPAGRPKFRPSK